MKIVRNQPDEVVIVFDYSLDSAAATVDFAEYIISYLKRRKESNVPEIIIQILKISEPEMADAPQNIGGYLHSRLIIENISCAILGGRENYTLTAAEAIKLLRLHAGIRTVDTPALTIFCNAGDKTLVWFCLGHFLDKKTKVLAFPLFRESLWRRVPRLFFEWARRLYCLCQHS